MKREEHTIGELLATTEEVTAPGEIIIGQFCGLAPGGEALVDFAQNTSAEPLVAISTLAVNHGQSGRQVALMFSDGDITKPLLIGFIHNPLQEMIESFELSAAASNADELAPSGGEEAVSKLTDDVIVDGKKIVFEGEEEVVLKCGEASITLTKAGKILIRGKYLLNRSSGVNRILGGSVQVN